MVSIDYEKLVADYLQSLTTVLRGFNAGAGYAFLETWVYDEDETKSLLGIIEAAKDARLSDLAIYLGPSTLKKFDLSALTQLASRDGKVTTEKKGEGANFIISFDTSTSRVRSSDKLLRFGSRTVKKTRAVVIKPAQYDNGTINPHYAKALQKLAKSRAFEGTLQAEPNLTLTQFSANGVILAALIDAKNIVQKVAYQGVLNDKQRGLVEGLCKLMVGKPILECSDHAVVFLEFELRDRSMPPPVPGIVTPENSDTMFLFPASLVHGLLNDYRKKTGFRSIENMFDLPISEAWRKLSQEERAKKIQSEIERHPLGEGIHVERMESPKRAIVGFREGLSGSQKQERLMRLEDYLKQTIEPTLQLLVEPKPDANKIRRMKEGY